jgi:hypothetical protein
MGSPTASFKIVRRAICRSPTLPIDRVDLLPFVCVPRETAPLFRLQPQIIYSLILFFMHLASISDLNSSVGQFPLPFLNLYGV